MKRRKFLGLTGSAIASGLAGCPKQEKPTQKNSSERNKSESTSSASADTVQKDFSWSEVAQNLERASGEMITLSGINFAHPDNYEFPLERIEISSKQVQELFSEGQSPEAVFEEIGGFQRLHQRMSDNIEVPILHEGLLDIDLIHLDVGQDYPLEETENYLNSNLNKLLTNTDHDIETRKLDIDIDGLNEREINEKLFDKIDKVSPEYETAKRNSELPGSIYQLFVSKVPYDYEGEGTYCGVGGESSFNSDYGFSFIQGECDIEKIQTHALHEALHGTLDLPHNYRINGVLSYNSNGDLNEIPHQIVPMTEFLAHNYLNSELSISREGENLVLEYVPGKVGSGATDQAFLRNIEEGLRDGLNINIQDWNIEDYNVGEECRVTWSRENVEGEGELFFTTSSNYDESNQGLNFDHQLNYELPV